MAFILKCFRAYLYLLATVFVLSILIAIPLSITYG